MYKIEKSNNARVYLDWKRSRRLRNTLLVCVFNPYRIDINRKFDTIIIPGGALFAEMAIMAPVQQHILNLVFYVPKIPSLKIVHLA